MRRCMALALFALVAASVLTFSEARVVGGNGKSKRGADDSAGLGLSTRPKLAALGGDPHTFEVANDMFLLDGEPFRIMSGE